MQNILLTVFAAVEDPHPMILDLLVQKTTTIATRNPATLTPPRPSNPPKKFQFLLVIFERSTILLYKSWLKQLVNYLCFPGKTSKRIFLMNK
jgi:hypothetical protein